MIYWFIVAGFLLLLVGSELVVRGGVGLAREFGLSPLLVGLLVVSVATSTPELFVALRAATTGAPSIALGSIVGGNIFSLLFVLGLGALIHPITSPPKVVLRDGGTLLAASLAVVFLALTGIIARRDGLLLLAAFVVYLIVTFFTDWRRSADHSVAQARALGRMQGRPPPVLGGLFLLLFGLIALALGAHFTVAGGTALARALHLQEAFLGLTIVAFGVSLPKLITTVVAAARGQTSLAVGHLIGAGIVNLLGVLGITAMVAPLPVSRLLASADVYVMAGACAVLLPLLAMKWRLSRPRGAILLLGYAGYLAFLAWRQGLLTPALLGIG